MKMNLTFHAQVERADRIEKIIDTIGFGEPYLETPPVRDAITNRVTTKILTTTGVIIVKNERNAIVTCYVASVKQAVECCCCGGMRIYLPKELFSTIRQHEKKKCNTW